MAEVVFDHVTRIYPGNDKPSVDDLNLDIKDGEFLVLVGPSGCGKSTTLRMLAGLEEVNKGRILIGGKDVTTMQPKDRDIAMVFQNYALYPHMTVADNIACVPKILKWDRDRIDARVDELLELVHLEPGDFRDRYPAQLSGGQQQRVGLVRALAASPELMLLDEPFGAIDAITRAKLQDELLRIHRGSGKTFIFVTHDVTEALKLGTKVLVVDGGRVQQYAEPQELLTHPATPFVRELLATQGYGSDGPLPRAAMGGGGRA